MASRSSFALGRRAAGDRLDGRRAALLGVLLHHHLHPEHAGRSPVPNRLPHAPSPSAAATTAGRNRLVDCPAEPLPPGSFHAQKVRMAISYQNLSTVSIKKRTLQFVF